MSTDHRTVDVFRDEHDGTYKVDYLPESTVRDRRARGYRTLAEARAAASERGYTTRYVGPR